MEYAEVVRKRRMVRNYQSDRPVPRSVLAEILDLAIRAPSAGFSQGWHFLVLDTPEDRSVFWNATVEPDAEPDAWLQGLQSAPVLILALSDKSAYISRYAEPDKGWTDRDEAHWPVPYWHIDTGMASLLILLGAVDHGLAGCFFGVPAERHDEVKKALGVPGRLSIIGVMSVGHPAPDRRSPSLKRGRRPVAEVVSYGRMQPGESE
ncbi:nitroreductase family protein [Jatrophihabitans sp.]|jgi:nitroreductase|uniref:nitroreductase family protein n=1 Tax=Jatrophihabitans sp. TaxID=1932789 RepID=UPI002EFC1FE2